MQPPSPSSSKSRPPITTISPPLQTFTSLSFLHQIQRSSSQNNRENERRKVVQLIGAETDWIGRSFREKLLLKWVFYYSRESIGMSGKESFEFSRVLTDWDAIDTKFSSTQKLLKLL
ncbi:hypothetical protein E3N88_00271 [Mikania micrantha]|uniref:Uncharacterized protein n=1 Tax=Mikania micrantha TaxID=192012 RepID=A0A5N6PXK4_9ASTR|nr:hypothetical protein E3N88_00271 [Mikania micrantha]